MDETNGIFSIFAIKYSRGKSSEKVIWPDYNVHESKYIIVKVKKNKI